MSVEALSQKWPFECSTDASFDRRTLRHPDVNRLELWGTFHPRTFSHRWHTIPRRYPAWKITVELRFVRPLSTLCSLGRSDCRCSSDVCVS